MAEDIRRELGLHREELVALAYFLGCDYTEGVTGVGIVNALEIVQAFPMRKQDNVLQELRDGKNGENAKNEKIGESGSTIGNNNGSEKGSDIENGPYPIVGLKKFKEWLEGYDFSETVNSKRKISSNVKISATGKGKEKNCISKNKKGKKSKEEKEAEDEEGGEGEGDEEDNNKDKMMLNKNIRRKKTSRKSKKSLDSSESEQSSSDSGSDSTCSDESCTKSITHKNKNRSGSKNRGKVLDKKNSSELLKLKENTDKTIDGDISAVQIIQEEREKEEDSENDVEKSEKLLPDLNTRLVSSCIL